MLRDRTSSWLAMPVIPAKSAMLTIVSAFLSLPIVACSDSGDSSTPDSGAGECSGGESDCNGECVDLKRNSENCGECGYLCNSDEKCNGGRCVPECDEGTICGAGMVCDSSGVCVSGCFVGGSLYAHGAVNPLSPCQVCTEESATDWTALPNGVPCSNNGDGACNDTGQCVRFPVLSAGTSHTCGVTSGGKALCWGSNADGRLGNGTTEDSSFPKQVAGLEPGVKTISAGGAYSCAIDSAGGARCWGLNEDGQLGNDTTDSTTTQTAVTGYGSGIKNISTGLFHTCAITSEGSMLCWGDNSYGQLGDGTGDDRTIPTQVLGLESGVTAITTGRSHTCALVEGRVLCWGYNGFGQLGNDTVTAQSIPLQVPGLESGVTWLAGGWEHTCAVVTSGTSEGALVCWGANERGTLGDGTTERKSVPTLVSGLESGVVSVSGSGYHTCAVTVGGGVLCWGANNYGQLGNGENTSTTVPTQVLGLDSGVIAVTVGGSHTCAVTAAWGTWCWGGNANGQIGDGTKAHRNKPVEVKNFQ